MDFETQAACQVSHDKSRSDLGSCVWAETSLSSAKFAHSEALPGTGLYHMKSRQESLGCICDRLLDDGRPVHGAEAGVEIMRISRKLAEGEGNRAAFKNGSEKFRVRPSCAFPPRPRSTGTLVGRGYLAPGSMHDLTIAATVAACPVAQLLPTTLTGDKFLGARRPPA
ncbi:hypothetical protein PG997_007015 [Apiospora hydei]|uniref:Uncharacterized protein n=1 Tax=Apiospora hydei TaxID=1337664 RepID=A0ABR1WS97_9PEZI